MLLLAESAQAAEVGIWAEAAARARGSRLARRPDPRPSPATRPGLPAALTGGRPTIGVRLPDHPAPRALAAAVGPLPTTSANVVGHPRGVRCARDPRGARRGRRPRARRRPGTRRPCVDGRRRRRASHAGRRSSASGRCPVERDRGDSSPPPASPLGAGRCGTIAGSRIEGGVDDDVASTGLGLGADRGASTPSCGPRWRASAHRQRDKIELIASENYTFAAVMEAQGSWLTNKYAEGLPGKRYYGGCEYVDVVERLAQERALALFPGAEHVNVQPHSGAQANMAAYFAVLPPGRPRAGHEPRPRRPPDPRLAGQLLRPAVRDPRLRRRPRDASGSTTTRSRRQAREVRPQLIVAGASAYPRIIDFDRMAEIAHERRRAAVRRHGPHRRARRRRPAPDRRSRTPTSSRRPPTRPCAVRAAA